MDSDQTLGKSAMVICFSGAAGSKSCSPTLVISSFIACKIQSSSAGMCGRFVLAPANLRADKSSPTFEVNLPSVLNTSLSILVIDSRIRSPRSLSFDKSKAGISHARQKFLAVQMLLQVTPK